MIDIKKSIFFVLGWLCLIMAYVGVITPGIPFSIFLVGAAYCFARSSKKMEDWIYNHRLFGPFLTNWENKRIFPKKAKYMMIAVMSSSLAIMYFTLPIKAMIYSGVCMFLVAVWAWRYPSSAEEWQDRKDRGERIGWIR
jgi:uncharacterized membrane protein YbaN (DUF454 family)